MSFTKRKQNIVQKSFLTDRSYNFAYAYVAELLSSKNVHEDENLQQISRKVRTSQVSLRLSLAWYPNGNAKVCDI